MVPSLTQNIELQDSQDSQDFRKNLELISSAASLLREQESVEEFRANFPQVIEYISQIPDHAELVNISNLDKLEDWQVQELRQSLLSQLQKSKGMFQQLIRTGVNEP